jgi:hypothetical protein
MKVDAILDLLNLGCSPKQVAARIGCSLSHVYAVRGRRELAELKHQVAELRLVVLGIQERLGMPRKHVA